MSVFDLNVECYSGHIYAQEPRAVVWQGRRYPVTCVLSRWRTPQGPAFRVRTEPGAPFDPSPLVAERVWGPARVEGPERLFELHYHELEERWTIEALFDHEP